MARELSPRPREMHETMQDIFGIKKEKKEKTKAIIGFQPRILRILIFYEKNTKLLLILPLGLGAGFFSD